MAHAFFKDISWDDIYHKRVEPPFKPSITNPTDTSNFDQEFTSVTPVLTPVQSGMFRNDFLSEVTSLIPIIIVLTQQMQEEFRGFSYVQDFA
jgi:hypothetical protein